MLGCKKSNSDSFDSGNTGDAHPEAAAHRPADLSVSASKFNIQYSRRLPGSDLTASPRRRSMSACTNETSNPLPPRRQLRPFSKLQRASRFPACAHTGYCPSGSGYFSPAFAPRRRGPLRPPPEVQRRTTAPICRIMARPPRAAANLLPFAPSCAQLAPSVHTLERSPPCPPATLPAWPLVSVLVLDGPWTTS